MDNKHQQALIEQRHYRLSAGRLSVYREEVLVFEREGCPFRIILNPEQVIIACSDGSKKGVAITRKDCPVGCPQSIWDEGFDEIEKILGPGTATGPWNVDSDGALLKLAHHRPVAPGYPLRSFILYLSIESRWLKGQKEPRWILGFAYSNDVTQSKHMSICYEGPCGGFCDFLVKEGGGYFLEEGKYKSFNNRESPVLPG